jgi:hypothetical protein
MKDSAPTLTEEIIIQAFTDIAEGLCPVCHKKALELEEHADCLGINL